MPWPAPLLLCAQVSERLDSLLRNMQEVLRLAGCVPPQHAASATSTATPAASSATASSAAGPGPQEAEGASAPFPLTPLQLLLLQEVVRLLEHCAVCCLCLAQDTKGCPEKVGAAG